MDVLLVEDDASIRDALAENLTEDGYTVATAEDGTEALHLLRSGTAPSVILLDLMMPAMDGWTFRIEQKKDPALANIPVIAVSANSTAQARAIDAAAFISKPLTPETVRAAVDRVLSQLHAERVEHAERLASLGTLTAGVAHEIGNPLTYVIANLQAVAGCLPDALPPTRIDIPDLVAEALEGANRIAEIVRNIQTLSHVTTREPAKAVDLRRVAEQAVKVVEHELRHRAKLELCLEPTLPVLASRGRLEQVIINFLMNAAHAVGESTGERSIRLATLNTADKRVRLEVADTGPGVPPNLVERIFEPFFTTKAVGVGTGLGLSICRAIIEEAGGKIGVESAPTGGALFWFELSRATARTAAEPRPAKVSRPGRLKVLVVDDDKRILGVVRRYLEPRHEVRATTETSRATELAFWHHPDVILCDLMMPNTSATDFVERLRAHAPGLARRVVFMTAGAFGPVERAAVEQGEHLVLVKPFSREQLEGMLARITDHC